jgi:cobaltochelatase CobT
VPAFPERVIDAVSACARALAGESDADAGLDQAPAGSVGGLRAFADRQALRRRFHSPAIHVAHQPAHPRDAQIFDALEQARLDALGAAWLAGVRHNLLAHPGVDDEAVRWLAFESLSGREGPDSKRDGVVRVRRAIPAPLASRLSDLAALIEMQEAFAPAAALWIQDAVRHIPEERRQPGRAELPLPPRSIRHLPRRGNPGGVAAALRKRATEEPRISQGEGRASGANMHLSAGPQNYRAYTTAHDRVSNAASLARREELADLRQKLESELSTIRPLIARLAKRLMRVILARQTRSWQFDLEEGVLDGARLAPFVASRGNARPFKAEQESPFPSTLVSLLIDHSGSMRGRPMLIAALTVEIFARVLERCGVRCEVLGFTTREWDGGAPAREWASAGYPPDPGRLNALEHIVIKSADMPWRRARAALGLFLHDEMLKENIDGEAVAWAHGRLLTRPELRRVLVVISDGTPMDEATLAANGHEYLEQHLVSVVEQIEARSPVKLAAIGIGHNVSAFYSNATTVARMEQLGPALTNKLTSLLGDS